MVLQCSENLLIIMNYMGGGLYVRQKFWIGEILSIFPLTFKGTVTIKQILNLAVFIIQEVIQHSVLFSGNVLPVFWF